MPSYSVATTKDNLSRLIDKALAGEEVIVTRHGKPTIAFRAVEEALPPRMSPRQAMEWLRERRESRPRLDISGAELVRQMRDESIG